jgi:CRP/FNR family transcriptional regulator, cyclic AMP receptor protein
MWTMELLDGLIFFDLFSTEEKKEIVALDNIFLAVKKHEIILQSGEKNSTFFILLKGIVYVAKSDNHKKIVAKLKPGDVFGEMSFLTHELPTETIVAKDDCTMIKLNDSQVRNLSVEIQNKIKDQLIRTLTQRIKRMNDIWFRSLN